MDTMIKQKQERKISPTLTLLALAVSAFAIGSTEFISVGVMPLIMQTFHVSLATAGLTVSVYAAGVMIGAPIFTSLTSRVPRKVLLLSIMITFIIGNLITAVAPIFSILLVGRVVAAFAHGLFMSVATVIAASVVDPMRRASAIATMFTGLTVATVTGVPLGTFIGQHASWRISFIVIALIGLVGLISNTILVPKELPMPAKIKRGSLMRMIKAPVVLLSLIVTAVGYGASFPVYSYMTTIISNQGWSDSASVIILIIYGLAVAIGNTIGGRVANEKPLKVLMMMFGSMIPMMLLMLIGLQAQIFGLILIIVMGLLAFMNVPGLQLFTMQAAEKYTPNDVQMASAFNIAAFNLGIMVGSYVGGLVADGASLYLTPVAGAMMATVALGLTWLLNRLHTD